MRYLPHFPSSNLVSYLKAFKKDPFDSLWAFEIGEMGAHAFNDSGKFGLNTNYTTAAQAI